MRFAFCDTFLIKLSARWKQFRLQSTIFSISRERRCLESLFSWGFGESFQAPAFPLLLVTLAPDVECEKLCGYSCYSWHSTDALKLQTVSQVRHRSFFHALHHFSSSPESEGLRARPCCPLSGAAWRNALLHAEQAKAGGHQALGFRGWLLRVIHNSWPLWTFQLRPLSLMGKPDGDLFIKTISWLFVAPAIHKRAANSPPPWPPQYYHLLLWLVSISVWSLFTLQCVSRLHIAVSLNLCLSVV